MNSTATPHIGRKISRIRELRGMKQETLAEELGISQQSVSQMEQSENLEDEKLDKVAKALGVSFAAATGVMPLDMPESILVRFKGEMQPGESSVSTVISNV